MARHKTKHRKRLEAEQKATRAARDQLLASMQGDEAEALTLKPNAAASLKAFKAAKK